MIKHLKHVLLYRLLIVSMFLSPAVSVADDSAHGLWGVGVQLGFAELAANQGMDTGIVTSALSYARTLAIQSGCIPTNEIDSLLAAANSTRDSRTVYPSITAYRQRLATHVVNNCSCRGAVAPSDKTASCDQYAKTAIGQNEENTRKNCGYTGTRWQPGYDAHFGWCMNNDQNAANSETGIRAEELRKCGQKPFIAGKWKLVEGYCAPGEVLTFTQTGDQVTSVTSKGFCSGGEYAEYEAANIQWQAGAVLTYRGRYTVQPPNWPEPYVDVTWKFLSNDIATGEWRKDGKSGPVKMERINDNKTGSCDQYAKTAISQNEENTRKNCGYTGARWQSGYDHHFGWCMNNDQSAANSETSIRTEELKKCGRPSISGLWRLVEGYCAPGELLTITQAGDQVTSVRSKGFCSGGEYAEYEAINIQWQSGAVLTYRGRYTVQPPNWPEPYVDVTWRFLSNDRATGEWHKNGKSGTVTMERVR